MTETKKNTILKTEYRTIQFDSIWFEIVDIMLQLLNTTEQLNTEYSKQHGQKQNKNKTNGNETKCNGNETAK